MWLRFGRWIELGVHVGRHNTRFGGLDRYFLPGSLRFGKREWNHGPRREEMMSPLNAQRGSIPPPLVDLYPDPEPLRWGVRKVVGALSQPSIGIDALTQESSIKIFP